MIKKSYSFNTRLQKVSKLTIAFISIVSVCGLLFMFGSYYIYIQTWIISNSPQSPGNLINPFNNTGQRVPYIDIFINNMLIIFIVPLMIIISLNFIMFRKKENYVRNEVRDLFKSIGLEQTNPTTGLLAIGTNKQLKVTFLENGQFSLQNKNISISSLSGDELLWKIRYVSYLESKNE